MDILAVDSNRTDLELLCTALEKVYPQSRIMAFEDPLMAVKCAFSQPAQMLVAALELKRIDGFTLAHMLLKRNPVMKVLIVLRSEVMRTKLYEQREFACICKPVSTEKLTCRD